MEDRQQLDTELGKRPRGRQAKRGGLLNVTFVTAAFWHDQVLHNCMRAGDLES
ncbi:hypothetical protein ElyMa_002923000 [Elysia marginata]|uniref:Uncharacterized protein n=1 Tax=Elysia marginata TaxID=1093978 RepID=A0AAV4I5M6_9GAST|nr:hypothetical protein ElyMa_002923000 [Elysia marginata]